MDKVNENRKKERTAFEICEKKVLEHKLDMKLVDVEYAFDSSKKFCFYFTADGRVDFRELVKSLASEFHTRIELRQIGVRDEAKKCWVGSAFAVSRSAAVAFSAIFNRFQLKWQRNRGFHLTLQKFQAAAAGLCAALNMSRKRMST